MAASSSSPSEHLHPPPSECFSEEEEEDDDTLAQFLEAEVLGYDEFLIASSNSSFQGSDNHEDLGGEAKRRCIEIEGCSIGAGSKFSLNDGVFGKIPIELFQNILKFLSSEDLSTCCRVCQFLRCAASDEVLWRRLYYLRWGFLSEGSSISKPRGSAWKQLYFETLSMDSVQRDKADMTEFVRNTPPDFREYYVQMQAAKRSQPPLPSQIKDDMWVVDPSVADQVTAWRKSLKLNDKSVGNHWCSGKTCSYHQIGDVFLCEKTGCAHVCDDTCREIVLDPSNDLLVCTVSGRCFDRWLSPAEEETEPGQQLLDNAAGAEEAEPFLGSGRLARAYWLGYNCIDEQELHEALREVLYPRCR
ncbi:hypothetical protein O6H91_06G124600 [Diphasiastrum complanatum]|uniref:Uncharacterized protein n=1 Tax=Diphasiastrum complanatum TaxID=34168 RepID=A0ACC2DIH1_DIPCM|nr:hypothetical protein O6H91_06G124600 [Diphasiastrum complanatum]